MTPDAALRGTFRRSAIAHDWLTIPGGSEKVLLELLELLPDADVFTSVYDPDRWPDLRRDRDVRVSFLDRLPGAQRHYPKLLPLMNAAFESFDLSGYDLVVSSSHSCAKNVLTDERDRFVQLDALGTAQVVAGQAIGVVAERTAVRYLVARLADGLIPGRDHERALRDRATQLELLRWRQQHILAGLARRLKGGIDAGRDPFAVLVDCQDHVVATARAWVDLTVLEAFADAVAACEDPALRAVLDRLCSLHALHRIEAERGWFQEHGRLTPQRSKAVGKAVNALCAEVRDDAALLVEALGVPEPALADAGPGGEADREARLARLRNPTPQPA